MDRLNGKSYSSVEEHAGRAQPRLACSSQKEPGVVIGDVLETDGPPTASACPAAAFVGRM